MFAWYVVDITSIDAYSGLSKIVRIDANNFDIDKTFTTDASGQYKLIPFRDNFNWAITRKDHLTGSVADEEIYLSSFTDPDIPEGMFSFDFSIILFEISIPSKSKSFINLFFFKTPNPLNIFPMIFVRA